MVDGATPEPVPVTLARLEGKVDAALAGHTAKLDEHSRVLDTHQQSLTDHDDRLRKVELEQASARPSRTSGWTVAGVLISGVVGLGALLGLLITLIQLVPHQG